MYNSEEANWVKTESFRRGAAPPWTAFVRAAARSPPTAQEAAPRVRVPLFRAETLLLLQRSRFRSVCIQRYILDTTQLPYSILRNTHSPQTVASIAFVLLLARSHPLYHSTRAQVTMKEC